jgi:hypothetical protein
MDPLIQDVPFRHAIHNLPFRVDDKIRPTSKVFRNGGVLTYVWRSGDIAAHIPKLGTKLR